MWLAIQQRRLRVILEASAREGEWLVVQGFAVLLRLGASGGGRRRRMVMVPLLQAVDLGGSKLTARAAGVRQPQVIRVMRRRALEVLAASALRGDCIV